MRKPAIYKSFFNAFRGVYLMIKSERNFRIELIALFINLFLIFYLELSETDAVLILIVSSGVLVSEILNTAIEKICDVVHPEFDEKIRFIKDIAAGAVALMTFFALAVGFLVYRKYFFN